MSIIVSAFPGLGKVYAKKSSELNIIDLNSVDYKYTVKILNSTKFREINPDYPNNFIEKIKELSSLKEGSPDIIFVPSHIEIRNSLAQHNLPYFIIYPYLKDKEKFIARYKERGNSDKFCYNMETNWDRYIDGIINDTFPIHIKAEVITEEMLKSFITYDKIIANTKQAIKSSKFCITDTSSVNWSIISKDKRNWSDIDFAYKDYIDWDMLCKFGKLPDSIITNKQFSSYIIWRYLEKNKGKYSLKARKLISKNM